jgi:peptide/nickel transport system substrate-binding protein
MTDFVPEIPAYYDATYVLHGSKVGNAYLSDAFGLLQLNKVFVKQ